MALKAIIIDDNLGDLDRIKHELSKPELHNEIEILGIADNFEDGQKLLYDNYYNIDLLLLDLTLESLGEVDPNHPNTGPNLLETVRAMRRSKVPFGVIFITKYIEIWAVDLMVTHFNIPETLLGVVGKWYKPNGEQSFAQQIAECRDRFQRRFMKVPDKVRSEGYRWLLKSRIDEYFQQPIFLDGAFSDDKSAADAGKSIKRRIRRDEISWFIIRDGYCEIKAEGDVETFKADCTGKELLETIGLTPKNGTDTATFDEYLKLINGYYFMTGANHYVNLNYVTGHNNESRAGTLPKGGWAVVGDDFLPISNIENRETLKKTLGIH